jgi:hypothetical protein
VKRSVQKLIFYKNFRNLCCKRMCRYRIRKSEKSLYIEVSVHNSVYLFRFSDHPLSLEHPWVPDFDITDINVFKRAKKFLKKHHKITKDIT